MTDEREPPALQEADDAPVFGEFELTEIAPRRATRSSVLLVAVLTILVAVALAATAVLGFRTVFRPTVQGACVLIVQCFDVSHDQVEALTHVAIPDDARVLSATASDGLKSKSLSAVLLVGDTPLNLSSGYVEIQDFAQKSQMLDTLANLGFDSIDSGFVDGTSFGGGSSNTVVFGRSADGSKLAAFALHIDL